MTLTHIAARTSAVASAQERRMFGAALAAALKTKGLNQTQFAGELGVTQSLISAWKRGEAEPPPERVFAGRGPVGP